MSTEADKDAGKDAAQAEVPAAEEGAEGEAAEGEAAAAKVVEEEEEAFNMAEDEHYPDGYVEKVFADSALSKRTMQFYQCYGLTSFKRYNFHWLGDNCFIFSTGNTY